MRNYYDQTAAWPPRRRGGRTAVVCFLIAIALLVGVAVLLRLLPAAELELPAGQDGDDHLHGLECDEHRRTCPAEPADAAGQRFFGVKQPGFPKDICQHGAEHQPQDRRCLVDFFDHATFPPAALRAACLRPSAAA